MARLRRADCAQQGITRRRRGRGFGYADRDGGAVADEETLERIGELAIPPAWKDVWICPDPLGHIQATGVDAAGRRQYLYHERWQQRAAQRKFESVRQFARQLPALRRAVSRDIAREGVPRERALACAVRLLDRGFFRIGGAEYAESNDSYGVATVLREHASLNGNEIVFDFPAKSGQRRIQSIRDAAVLSAIKAMRRRRSGPPDLLVYKEDDAWYGTVLAAVELAQLDGEKRKGNRDTTIREAVRHVADRLGNTPAVCRSSYIDPRVLDRFRDGTTIKAQKRRGPLSDRRRAQIEREVLDLID